MMHKKMIVQVFTARLVQKFLVAKFPCSMFHVGNVVNQMFVLIS